ncbi:MAG: hypothetical protein WB869_05110, partial [Candidatus Acidiferrales bacterium]
MRLLEATAGVRADRSRNARALRLGRFFNTTPELWVNLPAHYDLAISKQEAGEKINRDVHPMEITA